VPPPFPPRRCRGLRSARAPVRPSPGRPAGVRPAPRPGRGEGRLEGLDVRFPLPTIPRPRPRPEKADRPVACLAGERTVEPHAVRHHEDGYVARRRRVVEVGAEDTSGSGQKRAPTRARSPTRSGTSGRRAPRSRTTRSGSPARSSTPSRAAVAGEAVGVVAGELPGHERGVPAEPEARDEGGGEGSAQRTAAGTAGERSRARARTRSARPAGSSAAAARAGARAGCARPRPGPGSRRRLRGGGHGGHRLGVELPSTKPVTRSGRSSTRPPGERLAEERPPRWMRDMTVPTGTPSASAISA